MSITKRRSEAGIGMVEVLVAITIFLASVTAVVGSFGVTAKASDVQRRLVTMSVVAQNAIQMVQTDAYVSNATTASYSLSGPTVPTGFAVTVTSVQCWTSGSTNPATWAANCTGANETGVQLITVTATSTNSTLTVPVSVSKVKP